MEKDNELVKNIIDGKISDFDLLVEKYYQRIFRICYSFFYDHHKSEDITQEIFIKIFNNIRNFKFKSSFYTYIYRIAINEIKQDLRKKKFLFIELKKNILNNTLKVDSIEKELISKEEKKKLNNALNKLKFKHKNILILKEMENLNYKQISEILKIPIGTVESRLFKARKLLKKFYEAEL